MAAAVTALPPSKQRPPPHEVDQQHRTQHSQHLWGDKVYDTSDFPSPAYTCNVLEPYAARWLQTLRFEADLAGADARRVQDGVGVLLHARLLQELRRVVDDGRRGARLCQSQVRQSASDRQGLRDRSICESKAAC